MSGGISMHTLEKNCHETALSEKEVGSTLDPCLTIWMSWKDVDIEANFGSLFEGYFLEHAEAKSYPELIYTCYWRGNGRVIGLSKI